MLCKPDVRCGASRIAALVCLSAGVALGGAVYDSSSEPGVLKIAVDVAGATLDAAQVTDGITNILKTGPGDLTASPIPSYTGDITIDEGRFIVAQRGDFGANNVGTVYVNDGASIADDSSYGDWGNGLVSGKTFVFAGAPAAVEPSCKFMRLKDGGTVGLADWSTFRFLADATVRVENQRLKVSGDFDLGGHKLTFLRDDAKWTMFEAEGTVKNGGTFAVVGNAAYPNPNALRFLNANGTFGFAESEAPCALELSNASFEITRPLSVASATLKLSDARYYTVNASDKSDLTTYRWNGPIELSGANSLADTSDKATALTFAGPFNGTGTLQVGPGWVNLLAGAGGTFAGDVTITGTTNGKVAPENSGVALCDNSPLFPNAHAVTFTDGARLVLSGDNASALSALTFAGDVDSSITGGGVLVADLTRPTMAGLVKTGSGTLMLSNAVHVTGTTSVQGGALKLGSKVYGHAGLWEWKFIDMSKGDETGQNIWGSPSDFNRRWDATTQSFLPPLLSTNQEDAVYSRLGATKVFEGFDMVVANDIRRATAYLYQGYVWNRSAGPVMWQFAFHQSYRGSMVINGVWSPFGNPSEGAGRTNIFTTVLQPGPNSIMIYSCGASWNSRQNPGTDRFDGLSLSYDPNPVADEVNVEHFLKLDDGGSGRLLTIDNQDESAAAEMLPVFDELSFAAGTTFDLNGNAFVQGKLVGFPTVLHGDLTLTDSWTILAADLANGKALHVDGTLSFGEGVTLKMPMDQKPDHHAAKEYLIAEADDIVGAPVIDKASIELGDWKVVTTKTQVKLTYSPHALLIRVR